jgi:CRISPR/Cas system-associated exonuclease Cas4 (RecB family)
MTQHTVNDQFLYSLFSNVYYEHEYPKYDWNQVGTTEAIQCLLKSFFQRKLGRRLFEPKTVILSFGKIVHIALQKPLEQYGYVCEIEKPIPIENVSLMTHTDALHELHTLELKTISSMPTDILSQHFLQSNTYTVAHTKPIGYVGYIHKPSGICKVFSHKPEPRQFQYVCLRAVRLSHCLRHNITPAPEPSWLCRYCEYIDVCPNPQRHFGRKGGF